MIVIYHNPRCSKSRETLEILETKKADYKAIKYLDIPLGEVELIRKNEKLWKNDYKHLEFTDTELIQIMAQYPQLIERPIVINGDKAIIGRPPKRILDII